MDGIPSAQYLLQLDDTKGSLTQGGHFSLIWLNSSTFQKEFIKKFQYSESCPNVKDIYCYTVYIPESAGTSEPGGGGAGFIPQFFRRNKVLLREDSFSLPSN